MKTLSILVLLLVMAVGGLGYADYKQRSEVLGLEVKVQTLEGDIGVQGSVIISQQKELLAVEKKETVDRKVLLDIMDFLSHLQIETEPSGNGPRS
jgi:hypothetical protein